MEYNEAFYFLKELQGRRVEVAYNPQNNNIGVISTDVTHEDIQKMQELREDIIILLKDDPNKFKVARLSDGPGTELKKLLAKFGIQSNANCSCNERANIMDKEGNDWVEANMDTVLNWLQEESHKRKLPFFKTAAKVLVKKAIANSRKKEADRLKGKK